MVMAKFREYFVCNCDVWSSSYVMFARDRAIANLHRYCGLNDVIVHFGVWLQKCREFDGFRYVL